MDSTVTPPALKVLSVRLTEEKHKLFTEAADRKKVSPSQLLSRMIDRELKRREEKPDPVLAECVGIRLLLVNLLRPACVDSAEPFSEEIWLQMLDEIKRIKHEIALEIQTGEEHK